MSSTRAACVADALATQAGDADVEHVADVYRRGGSIADLSDALFSALTDAAAGCVQGGGASSPTTSTPGSTVAPTTTSPGGHGSTPPSRASTSSSQAVAQALLQSDDHYTTKQASCVAGQLVADLGRSEYDQLLAYLEGRSKGADNGVIEVYNDARAVCGVGS